MGFVASFGSVFHFNGICFFLWGMAGWFQAVKIEQMKSLCSYLGKNAQSNVCASPGCNVGVGFCESPFLSVFSPWSAVHLKFCGAIMYSLVHLPIQSSIHLFVYPWISLIKAVVHPWISLIKAVVYPWISLIKAVVYPWISLIKAVVYLWISLIKAVVYSWMSLNLVFTHEFP